MASTLLAMASTLLAASNLVAMASSLQAVAWSVGTRQRPRFGQLTGDPFEVAESSKPFPQEIKSPGAIACGGCWA